MDTNQSFLVRNKVEGARRGGAGNTHLKLKISQEDATFEVVASVSLGGRVCTGKIWSQLRNLKRRTANQDSLQA